MKHRNLTFKGHLWALGRAVEGLHTKEVDNQGREWFAITAFPLFAGTFGTIASALNICAIVQPWRCNIGGTYSLIDIKDIPDPAWQVQVVLELTKKGSNFRPRLIVCNSISLVFGIAANIATLLMRSDISFPLSRYLLQLVFATIACGYIAALILIALVVSAFKELQEPSPVEHAFTEAYFYAIEAAALYFLTSSFVIYTAYMIWNSHRTRDDLANQFGGGHLSLKILTIIFMAYILIGAKIFSHIEGWRYLDGVFWADVTILTVGFGDFKPMTHLGRALLFPYAAFGIFFLFLILYCVTQVVFERGGSLWEARIRDQQRRREVQRRKTNGRPRTLKSTTPEIQPPLPTFYNPRTTKKTHLLPAGQQTSNNSSSDGEKISKKWKHEARERRREEFEKMQEIALRATSRRIFLSIGLWLLFSIFLWMGGAVLFYLSEHHQGWTYFNAVYFTFISLLTIGYGDNNLISMPGKAIFVLWSLIVIPSLTMLISTGTELVGMPYLTRTKKWIREKLSQNKIERGTKPKARLSKMLDSTALEHNNHDKNHLIVQAIKFIARDHIQNQANNTQAMYSFEDWEYIFYLMGFLDHEESGSHPATASAMHAEEIEDVDLNGVDVERGRPGDMINRRGGLRERSTGMEQWVGDGQGEGEVLNWLHGKNPLNVSETLTEWMLLTLVERLESELKQLRREMGNTPVDRADDAVVQNGS